MRLFQTGRHELYGRLKDLPVCLQEKRNKGLY